VSEHDYGHGLRYDSVGGFYISVWRKDNDESITEIALGDLLDRACHEERFEEMIALERLLRVHIGYLNEVNRENFALMQAGTLDPAR